MTGMKTNVKDHDDTTSFSSLWTDKLELVSFFEDPKKNHGDHINSERRSEDGINILSWNVLAESFLTPRSHPGLPEQYVKVVFNPKRRLNLLLNTLTKLINNKFDILCLQEVDMREDIEKCLKPVGFQCVHATRIDINNTRQDAPKENRNVTNSNNAGNSGCTTVYNACRYNLIKSKVIHFDDLMYSPQKLERNKNHQKRLSGSSSSLSGMVTSYNRRNTALLILLEDKKNGRQFCVANGHLYWNPGYEYVKLSQCKYLLYCSKKFAETNPVIICGDFNSKPSSVVYKYLINGSVDARTVAPWFHHYYQDQKDGWISEKKKEEKKVKINLEKLSLESIQPHINEHKKNSKQDSLPGPTVKYILDYTLNRFTRWLRILGVDAALETEEEENQRTKEGKMVLFERCYREKRTLLTTSYKLLLRKDCPPGTYLLNPQKQSLLEMSLVHLLVLHGVVLKPSKFLTRCVICNGDMVQVQNMTTKKQIFQKYGSPDFSDRLDVLQCNKCDQGYWWSEEPTSSASRVKLAAKHLFQLCLRGGVAFVDEGENAKQQLKEFWGLDLDLEQIEGEKERKKQKQRELIEFENTQGEDIDKKYLLPGGVEEVIGWLKNPALSHEFQLQSAYSSYFNSMRSNENKRDAINTEDIPFTNVTSSFVGLLDYIFYEKNKFHLSGRLYVPKSFKELNSQNIGTGGHLIPSDIWPSDHLAIGARVEFIDHEKRDVPTDIMSQQQSPSLTVPSPNVPNNIDEMKEDNPPPNTPFVIPRTHIPTHIMSRQRSLNAQEKVGIEESKNEQPTTRPISIEKNETKIDNRIDNGNGYDHDNDNCNGKDMKEDKRLPKAPLAIPSAYIPTDIINQLPSLNSEQVTMLKKAKANQASTKPLKNEKHSDEKSSENASDSKSKVVECPTGTHGDRCKCGCLPNILSIFEMAELRKKYRIEQAKKKKQSNS